MNIVVVKVIGNNIQHLRVSMIFMKCKQPPQESKYQFGNRANRYGIGFPYDLIVVLTLKVPSFRGGHYDKVRLLRSAGPEQPQCHLPWTYTQVQSPYMKTTLEYEEHQNVR